MLRIKKEKCLEKKIFFDPLGKKKYLKIFQIFFLKKRAKK